MGLSLLRIHGRRDRPVDAVSVPQHHTDLPVARPAACNLVSVHDGRRDPVPEGCADPAVGWVGARGAVLLPLLEGLSASSTDAEGGLSGDDVGYGAVSIPWLSSSRPRNLHGGAPAPSKVTGSTSRPPSSGRTCEQAGLRHRRHQRRGQPSCALDLSLARPNQRSPRARAAATTGFIRSVSCPIHPWWRATRRTRPGRTARAARRNPGLDARRRRPAPTQPENLGQCSLAVDGAEQPILGRVDGENEIGKRVRPVDQDRDAARGHPLSNAHRPRQADRHVLPPAIAGKRDRLALAGAIVAVGDQACA